MKDGDFLVDILDERGNVASEKLRKDIIKGKDIYHAVYCVVVTPKDKLAVSKIANRQDLPNLHAGSYGCTAATIKRKGETGDEAMYRALRNELGVSVAPELVDERMFAIDGSYRKIGMYKVVAEVPVEFSKQDIDEIIELSPQEFKALLRDNPEKITPILRLFFENYCQS